MAVSSKAEAGSEERGSSARRYDLVVFDWDGTVMDSVAAIVGCMQETARILELGEIPERKIREAVGLGLDDTLESLVPGSEGDLRGRIVDTYRRLWFRGFRDRPLPFPEAEACLRGLEREGYLLAVATGKARRGLERDLEVTGFGRFFHATRTADESFPKPHPRMLEEVIEDLGSRRERTLMVGDTTWDLEMAAGAGVDALAVTCGSHDRGRLEALEPRAILAGLGEVGPWLAREGSASAGAGEDG